MPQRTRKTCPKCSTEKAINDFPRSSRRADGHGSWCRSCTAIYSRQRRRDPEVKRRESERAAARYAAMTDEERCAYIARGVARRRTRGEGQLARYGLTRSDYDALLASQGGGCAMCGREPTSGRLLAVDHDHSCCPAGRGCCGKCVRGLLCVTCNVWLGFYENESWTSSAEAYLSRYCLREADRLGVES